MAPGETTDDTAMMLGIARACGPEGIDMETVAANFVAWMASGPKDIGNATREALWRIRSGARWDEAGEAMQAESRSGVAGNGSVMRVAPVALRFRSSPERMIHAAFDSSRVTHANPRAKWGCVAVCQGLAHLLDGGQVEGVLEAARDIPEPSVVEAVRSAAYRAEEDVDSGGFVLVTVNAAFWCLLRAEHAGDVGDAGVRRGHDGDRLRGARWGGLRAGDDPAAMARRRPSPGRAGEYRGEAPCLEPCRGVYKPS